MNKIIPTSKEMTISEMRKSIIKMTNEMSIIDMKKSIAIMINNTCIDDIKTIMSIMTTDKISAEKIIAKPISKTISPMPIIITKSKIKTPIIRK